MNKHIINLLFIVSICFVAYIVFRNIDFKEGMETSSDSPIKPKSTSNGIAGNAQNYSANVKSTTIQNKDKLLITKYRTDYENTILNLDDLVNTMMLETALSTDVLNPMKSLDKLNQLNSARGALNSVMKFIDTSK
jgi:hypothetical protein